jgi:hypothetical protein
LKTIEYTKKSGKSYIILLDDEDFEAFGHLPWNVSNAHNNITRNRSALERIRGAGQKIYLWREITKCPDGMTVDHINGNRLDNRRCNLRVCTHQQNNWNIGTGKRNNSGFRGVFFCKPNNNWSCHFKTPDGQRLTKGGFATPKDAAQQYDAWAIEYRGEFAKPNIRKEV